MPKGTSLILIIWNVVLTALLGWSLMRNPAAGTGAASSEGDTTSTAAIMPMPLARDTGLLKDARIAYYELDSVETGFALIAESKQRVVNETKRRQEEIRRETEKAQLRAKELMQKDETFMTNAEQQASAEATQLELQSLDRKIGQMRMDAEETLDKMQEDLTREINDEIVAAMEEYNKTAGFDYIISVAEAGQVWPGNKGLNVTKDIIQMLNARHAAGKR